MTAQPGKGARQLADAYTDRRVGAATAAAVWAGPVSLWLWAEAAVLHGAGPAIGEFTG
ncbi:hypothetical protein [Nocardia niwae]|uniref:Uncharacterized protein n=1 Tax=Nocardia niwae TaxID=626084 RepID=A0ABV2X7S1_9NOCA